MSRFVVPRQAEAGQPRPAVHRTVLVVDVERFGSYHRTNPDRLVVRNALYRALRGSLARVGVVWNDCHREDRGDGVLVLVPSEVAKSLLVEWLPDHLVASLTEHNHSHGVGEQMRLRMALHAGEIHHDSHGVVGEAVNHACRLIDAPALKSALADSAGTLAVIVSSWFFTEVVRHCPGADAAAYRPVRVVEKETDTTGWIHLPDGYSSGVAAGMVAPAQQRRTEAEPSVATHRDVLWVESDRSARRLGARRTAYPLDLSIAELHNRGLYVPATFSGLAGGERALGIERLAADIQSGSSVLILGEPGSGKSVASYALVSQLRRGTPTIVARVSDLRRALGAAAPSSDLAVALRRANKGTDPRPVLVIDGLDETLGEFDTSADLSDLLDHLNEHFSLVVTCRRREFEDTVAHSVDSGAFDSIYTVDTWSLEGQFADLVERLVRGGLLESDELLHVIRRSPDLAHMVVRPLYARMLTFLGQEGLSAVTSVSSLYAEYIDKLAAASDVALAGAGCRMSTESSELWVHAAWQIYSQEMLHEDRFRLDTVTALLKDEFAAPARCLSRAMSQVCDQRRVGGRVWGSFVHYSFFEYLVSRYYVQQLNNALSDGAAGLMHCLSIDPSPEIRHFVVDELRAARVPGLADALERAYVRLRASQGETPEARTTGNLIAYLLSRGAGEGQACLQRLLDDETDMFLQQSLLWGLCHRGDGAALVRFVREARRSAQWRAWNRGYVMYYYGDIDRRAEPPYVDDDRKRSWGRTRERSIALMSASHYHNTVPAQRRYLDLYLLYDYAIWRGEVLNPEDGEVAKASLEELWAAPDIDGALLHELQAMHAVVYPSTQ